MARGSLTPQDIENRKEITARLLKLLSAAGTTQVAISEKTGIPKSTLTGYFKGTSTPNPGNVQLLADFFEVKKSDIDPRFAPVDAEASLKQSDSSKKVDLKSMSEDPDTVMSWNGRPIPPEEMEMIRRILDGGK
jgi:transcriptional regulator with XRE-family HTH domain